VRLRLIPRDVRFFDLFVEDAANVLGGARLLEAMLRTYDQPEARAAEIRATEHRGDEISHDIGHRLEATFVTPFDREDIYALISGLDDVLDFIEEVADTFVLYRIEAPTAIAVEQASIIVKQVELLHDALAHLQGFKGLDRYWIEVHRLENDGDRIVREAIAKLFLTEKDPINLVRWKDVYGLLEDTIDKGEVVQAQVSLRVARCEAVDLRLVSEEFGPARERAHLERHLPAPACEPVRATCRGCPDCGLPEVEHRLGGEGLRAKVGLPRRVKLELTGRDVASDLALVAEACLELHDRRIDDGDDLFAGDQAGPKVWQHDVVAFRLPHVDGTDMVTACQTDTG
jgi:predicted phosphate transport protein (TIGR00153 family)